MKTNKFFISAIALGIVFTAFTACSDDDPAPLPPIGGYNNAGEIGTADLLAYWPLNGDGVEDISNTAPESNPGVTFVDGIKGRGADLNSGYLKYPSIAALSGTLNSFTISAWAKVYNNRVVINESTSTGSPSVLFSMARPNEWEGNINLFAETGQMLTGVDSVAMKGSFRSTVSGGQSYVNELKLQPWMIDDNVVTPGKHVANANKVGGTWAHTVFTWDGATNKLIIYSNGVKISSPAFEVRGDNTSIVMDTPTYPMIGAFGNVATTTDSWNKAMKGQVDEIRVWKKALTPGDINALYELEKAGR